jgi:hypothetical protein
MVIAYHPGGSHTIRRDRRLGEGAQARMLANVPEPRCQQPIFATSSLDMARHPWALPSGGRDDGDGKEQFGGRRRRIAMPA